LQRIRRDLHEQTNELEGHGEANRSKGDTRQTKKRVSGGLRYSYEDAGGIIEDPDTFGWGATCSRLRATPAQGPRRVLPFRRSREQKKRKKA
jgi:hypothetical protein